ncbi:hypothetical protein GWA97_11465 [Flavobacterium sp. LaA7.5]|nr:hypothetical protein [Flavobacterium salilacus subsp. altitudinum]
MEKKTNIKKEDIIVVVKETPPTLYSIWLAPGSWKKLFTKEEYHILIIECLNSTVCDNKMKISGYLLTYNSLCLILGNEEENCRKVLLSFFERIKKAILQHRKKSFHKEESIKLSPYHLFKKHDLNSPTLIKLLTGKAIRLPYYDAQLARLKNKLEHEPFCSVLDYSGAIGPVLITKLENETAFTIVDIAMMGIETEYLIT